MGLTKAGEIAVDDDGIGSTDSATVAACGCPEQIITLKDSSATFTGLSQEEEYFPMISGIALQPFFFGFPPNALRPAAVSQDLSANANIGALISALDSTKSKETMPGNFDDLRDASQDDYDVSNAFEGGNTSPSQSGTSTQTSISGSNNSTRAGTPLSEQSYLNTQQTRRSPINIKLRVRKRSSLRCASLFSVKLTFLPRL
jgi:hypothetical protein